MFDPLTPTSFLVRSATVFAHRTAVVDRGERLTYADLERRTARLSGALLADGLQPGERVAVLAPNTRVALETTLGIPRSGAALLALNTRLAPAELAWILDHAQARVLIVDPLLAETADAVVALLSHPVRRIDAGPGSPYEQLLAHAEPATRAVEDEGALLSVNYTSGTTGRPKGAMYHHRGAYLQALAMAYHAKLDTASNYLWTLPMFHCNGWCFPWAVTAAGATHVCLPQVEAGEVWRLIQEERVTHACAAPTVITSIVYSEQAPDRPPEQPVTIATGGAPPSPALLERAARRGIDVVHLYGLTETFGPAMLCDWQPEWDALEAEEQAARQARQGVGNVVTGQVRVLAPEGTEQPWDGESLGELAIKGDNVMAGYLDDPEQTEAALPDGFLRTGDLAVRHPDGYVEIRDRAKDIILSGGENIASIEVEQALDSHPAVWESAVVASAHEHWGEVPVAFVQLRPGHSATAEDLITHVRGRLAGFKAPKAVEFGELPRTSTGKIQKYLLRERLRPRTT